MSNPKVNFTLNLPLKVFRSTIANADTENLKFLHTIFDTYLDHMLATFEPNPSYGPKCTNLFDKALMPFCRTFLQLKQMLNAKL